MAHRTRLKESSYFVDSLNHLASDGQSSEYVTLVIQVQLAKYAKEHLSLMKTSFLDYRPDLMNDDMPGDLIFDIKPMTSRMAQVFTLTKLAPLDNKGGTIPVKVMIRVIRGHKSDLENFLITCISLVPLTTGETLCKLTTLPFVLEMESDFIDLRRSSKIQEPAPLPSSADVTDLLQENSSSC